MHGEGGWEGSWVVPRRIARAPSASRRAAAPQSCGGAAMDDDLAGVGLVLEAPGGVCERARARRRRRLRASGCGMLPAEAGWR